MSAARPAVSGAPGRLPPAAAPEGGAPSRAGAPLRPQGDSRRVAGNLLSGVSLAGGGGLFHTSAPPEPLAEIERARARLGLSVLTLCREANVSERSYRWWRQMHARPPRPALQRLATALERAGRSGAAEAGATAEARLIAATLAGVEAVAAPLLPGHCGPRAGLARHVAIWAAALLAGVRQARIAAHLRLSRAAVCLAIRRVETLAESDPPFRAALTAAMAVVFPEEDLAL